MPSAGEGEPGADRCRIPGRGAIRGTRRGSQPLAGDEKAQPEFLERPRYEYPSELDLARSYVVLRVEPCLANEILGRRADSDGKAPRTICSSDTYRIVAGHFRQLAVMCVLSLYLYI